MSRQLLGLTLFLAAVLLLRKVWNGKMRCRLQYSLWLLVALRLLMPPFAFENPLWTHGPGVLLDRLENAAAVQTGFEAEAPAAPDTVRQGWTGAVPVQSSGASFNRHETAVSPGRPIRTSKEIAEILWAAGVLFTAAWIFAGNLYFRRRLRRNRMCIGQAEGLNIYVSEALDTPCLCAGWKPAVYLTPESLASEEGYRHVLTHELTHYRHKDHIWCMLRSLCKVLYWFHPLVWMAGRAWAADCEKACDEGTIAALGEEQKTAYGRTLIEMLSQRPLRSKITHCCSGLQEGKKAMKERITLIAGKQKKRIWIAVPALLLTLLLAAATTGCGRQADKTAAKQTEMPQSKTEDEQILEGAVLSSSQTDASGVQVWALDLDQNGKTDDITLHIGEPVENNLVTCRLEVHTGETGDGQVLTGNAEGFTPEAGVSAYSPDGKMILLAFCTKNSDGTCITWFYRYAYEKLYPAGAIPADIRTLDQKNESLMLYRDKDVLKLLDGNDPTRPARQWYWNGAQMEELPAV